MSENAPLEAVRKKAKDVLGDLCYREIHDLVLSARNGSQEAMKALFDDSKNWGDIIVQCFSEMLFNDPTGNIKTLIRKFPSQTVKKRPVQTSRAIVCLTDAV